MKIIRYIILCLIVVLVNAVKANAQKDTSSQIRHVVIVTFKPGTTDSSKHIVDKTFRQASDAFPMIKAFEWGWDDNDKTQPKHIYVTTFNNKGDLTTYNASPQIQAAKKTSSPYVANITTVDYPVNK
jgi:Stress responsive A/B Barrel Domain.